MIEIVSGRVWTVKGAFTQKKLRHDTHPYKVKAKKRLEATFLPEKPAAQMNGTNFTHLIVIQNVCEYAVDFAWLSPRNSLDAWS